MKLRLIRKSLLRVLSITCFLLLITLLILSRDSGQSDLLLWQIAQYCAPLLFLGIWVPYALSFLLDSSVEMRSLSRSIMVMIFGSIIIVLGALMLNTRMLFIIMGSVSNLFEIQASGLAGQFLLLELTAGVIIPLNEEIIKILPILVISHAKVISFNPDEGKLSLDSSQITQILISRRQYILYAIISGTVFTFFELFLYQWESIQPSLDPFSDVYIQLALRTLAPLHILATIFFSLGIYTLKTQLTGVISRRVALFSSLKFFLLGWGLHSLWNSLGVYFLVFLPEMQDLLYMILLVLGVIINISLILIIWRVFRITPDFCTNCGFEGNNHLHSEKKITTERVTPSRGLNILPPRISRFRLASKYICPHCFNKIRTDGICAHCGSRIYPTCPNCNTFLSETTTICPICRRRIISLDEMSFRSLSMVETWIIGLSALTSLAFILTPLSILFWLRQEAILIPLPIYIFYFIMGLVIVISMLITLFFNRTMGILVLYCHILNLFLLGIISLFGSSFIGILLSIRLSDPIGGFLVLGIIIIMYSFVKRIFTLFYHSYRPIFPEFLDLKSEPVEGGVFYE